MTDQKLAPCPFCGAAAEVSKLAANIITCTRCLCRLTVPPMCTTEDTAAYAAHKWNTRCERTCEMDDYETGDKAEYADCEEHIYHCESCHEERGVYAYNENGDVWAEKPKFCPACGARVVER